MLPAALLGVNGRVLLERALAVDTDAARVRGRRIAEAVLAGRETLVLRRPTPGAGLADWSGELVAAGTGKSRRGAVPAADAPPPTPSPHPPAVTGLSADPL